MSYFLTISTKSQSEYKDKGSKFYGYASPLSAKDDVESKIDEIKSIHPKARHICYAYRLIDKTGQVLEYATDAGEPSHSAGAPILRQIISFNYINTIVIVVRYFGGTNLGIPGLIAAYGGTAHIALNKAVAKKDCIKEKWSIQFSYDQSGRVEKLLKQANAEITSKEFTEVCTFTIQVPIFQLEFLQKSLKEAEIKFQPAN